MDQHQLNQLASLGIKTTPKPKIDIFPLLSISGLTIISFGGLLLLKNKSDATPTQSQPTVQPEPSLPAGRQVPKSIQHYLLTSQQFFLEAVNHQNTENITPFVNQAITTISEAIQLYPQDYRGWEQRGKIYQSIVASQPQLLPVAIIDFKQATSLNPTKVENYFYLAQLQEQAGLLSDGLATYYRLLSLVTQKDDHLKVITEIQSIRRLLSQTTLPTNSPSTTPILEGNLIQASLTTNLIIASPETSNNLTNSSTLNSNSLSGNSLLPANQKSITLTNTRLKSTSQVYLTILKGGKNQNLQVLSKSRDSFTIGLDTPITEPIEFKWWIVNP